MWESALEFLKESDYYAPLLGLIIVAVLIPIRYFVDHVWKA